MLKNPKVEEVKSEEEVDPSLNMSNKFQVGNKIRIRVFNVSRTFHHDYWMTLDQTMMDLKRKLSRYPFSVDINAQKLWCKGRLLDENANIGNAGLYGGCEVELVQAKAFDPYKAGPKVVEGEKVTELLPGMIKRGMNAGVMVQNQERSIQIFNKENTKNEAFKRGTY